jgi:uncharacterized membrane protein YhaH (DUF805 family)
MSEPTATPPRFPSRLAYLFLGLPFALLLNSLLVLRITPGLCQAIRDLDVIATKLPISDLHEPYSWVLIGLAVFALFATAGLTYARARRLDSDFPALWALLACVPLLGVGVAIWLGSLNDEESQSSGLTSWKLAGQLAVPALLCWVMLVALAAVVENKFFPLPGNRGYLSVSTLIALPLVTAALAGFLSARANRTLGEGIGAAFLTMMAVLMALGFAAMEGVICVLMAAPFVGLLALIGAPIGHGLAKLTSRPAHQVQSAAWLLVIVVAAGESFTPPLPLEDSVSSEVVIDATTAQVWAQLKDIRHLPPPTEPLFVFGVAHPLEAFVVGEGRVGATRICRLSTGDMPELISTWIPEKELGFTVLETPATMREATLFGRDLDAAHLHSTYASLDGNFRLEALPDGRTRLIGTSHYLLTVAPSPYWNLWTRKIVAQVQLRVMNHVKAQAEAR